MPREPPVTRTMRPGGVGHAVLAAPADDRAGGGHAGAEADEQHEVALGHPAVVDGVDEGERDARRRRVAGAVEHDGGAVVADAEAVAGGLDDADVRLVRHDERDVVGRDAGVGHRLLRPSRP